MSDSFDNTPIEFKCPECGRKLKSSVGAARRSRTVRCSGGHSVKLEGAQFDKQLRDLTKTLRRFGDGL